MPDVTLLAIRPHPDDEVTGTGGILARYSRRGARVGVLTCTLGEEGEMHDPDLDPVEAQPRLGQIREKELHASCEVLGVHELRLLGYRDSGMVGTEANKHPAAFWNAPLDEAGGRMAAIIRELRPRVIVTENENGTYGHPDHIKCHFAAVRGVELAADPGFKVDGLAPWSVDRLYANELVHDGFERVIELLKAENLPLGWFEQRGQEGGPPPGIKSSEADAAVDVSEYAPLIREALEKHRTQIPADSFLLQWPVHILKEMFHTAYLRNLKPGPNGTQIQDVLHGLTPRPGEHFPS